MILGLQITAILFSIGMIYFAIINFKKGEISANEIVSWIVIWVATLVIIVFPDVLSGFAKTFQFARLFDMMVVGGFIVVLIMVSISYMKVKRSEKKLEELVRTLALKNGKKSK